MEYLDLNVPPQAEGDGELSQVAPNSVYRNHADNVAADNTSRRQGRKKAEGVREEGIQDLDEAFREGPFVDYLMRHGHKVIRIRDSLQIPPDGLFTWKDLTWNVEADSETKSGREGDPPVLQDQHPGKKQMKLIAYIPWDRVTDFVNGEQSARKDVETTFVRDKFDPTNVGDKKHYRWNCHIEYQR